jgi:hypothetical protein
MKEYFFLTGKEQNGPFTIEQLEGKGLNNETLIWAEGMDNWQKLKDIPELVQTLKPKSIPPPPPTETNEKISKTEVSGQLKVTTDKIHRPIKLPRWLIFWCAFNLFALLFSYSGIKYFNQNACWGDSSRDTDEFWPFSGVLRFEDQESGGYGWCGYTDEKYFGNYIEFNGFFYNYDLTEFAFYVGGAFFIFFLLSVSKNDEEKRKI